MDEETNTGYGDERARREVALGGRGAEGPSAVEGGGGAVARGEKGFTCRAITASFVFMQFVRKEDQSLLIPLGFRRVRLSRGCRQPGTHYVDCKHFGFCSLQRGAGMHYVVRKNINVVRKH